MQSRRRFLSKTLFGSGLALAGLPAIVSCTSEEKESYALPSSGSTVVRKDISQLPKDDASLQALKDAVGVMKKRSERHELDPRGWYANAVQHSMFCATNEFERQVHYTWLFYPWHRAYLYVLEKKLQKAINEPGLALHYWDWTKAPYIPDAYWGRNNPLNDRTRMANAKDRIPDDYMNIDSHLRTPYFKAFGGYPKTTADVPFGEGTVEQSTHNAIHNWIGGNMDNFATAATDPIFTGHHGNVDRIWDAWLAQDPSHKNPIDEAFLNYEFYFTDPDGYPITLKVKDVLDTDKLGYRFDTLDFTKTYAGANQRPLPGQATPVLTETVSIDPDKREAIATALNTHANRVVVIFDRLKLPAVPLCVRVFINEAGKPINSDIDGTAYVTTVNIIPVNKPNTAHLAQEVIMQAELGSHVASLVASGRPLQATFEPVKVPGRPLVFPTVTMKDIRIGFDQYN